MQAPARQRFFHVSAGAGQASDVIGEVLTFEVTQAEAEENGVGRDTRVATLPPHLITIVVRTAAVSGQTMLTEDEPTWEDAEWQ